MRQVAQLVRPCERSLRSLVAEFLDRGEPLVPWVLDDIGDDFPRYVEARRRGHATGIIRQEVPAGSHDSDTDPFLIG